MSIYLAFVNLSILSLHLKMRLNKTGFRVSKTTGSIHKSSKFSCDNDDRTFYLLLSFLLFGK